MMFLGVDLFVFICLGFIGTHQSVDLSLLSLLEQFYSSLCKYCLCLTYFPPLITLPVCIRFSPLPSMFLYFLYILTFSLPNTYRLDNFSSSTIHLTDVLLRFVHSAVNSSTSFNFSCFLVLFSFNYVITFYSFYSLHPFSKHCLFLSTR